MAQIIPLTQIDQNWSTHLYKITHHIAFSLLRCSVYEKVKIVWSTSLSN